MYLCYFCMSYCFVSNKIVVLLIPFLSLCQSQRLLVWSTGEQWVSCTRCSSVWVSSSFLCSPTLSQTGAGSRLPSLCPTSSSCVITGKNPNKQKRKKKSQCCLTLSSCTHNVKQKQTTLLIQKIVWACLCAHKWPVAFMTVRHLHIYVYMNIPVFSMLIAWSLRQS